MTKLAPLVLICIAALALFSVVGFTLSYGITSQVEAALSKSNTAANGFPNALAKSHRLMGDPIDDPKPNKQ